MLINVNANVNVEMSHHTLRQEIDSEECCLLSTMRRICVMLFFQVLLAIKICKQACEQKIPMKIRPKPKLNERLKQIKNVKKKLKTDLRAF